MLMGIEDSKSREFSKQFPHAEGRGGYNRSGELVPIFYDSYWKGRLSSKASTLEPGRTDGTKKRLGSRSDPPENTLYAPMSSPRVRRLCQECRLSRRSRSSYGSRRKTFTSLIVNRWTCSKQSASAPRFGEQACIAYSRWDESTC